MTQLRLVAPCPSDTSGPAAGAHAADVSGAHLVPARLLLALAGRCSCEACCAALAGGRPEPHDPRRAPAPQLRAV